MLHFPGPCPFPIARNSTFLGLAPARLERYFPFPTLIMNTPTLLALAGISFTLVAVPGRAQLAVTANDNHLTLVNGVKTVVANPPPDTVSIVDMGATPPKIVAEVMNVPSSIIGPPLSVAVTPDESLALVTCSMKVDPADPTKEIEDNKLSVIDLKATPPAVIATLETGKAPAGLSINRQGTLALIANRGDGSVSIYSINGKTVTPAGKVQVGNETSALGQVAISPEGKTALLSRDADNTISILKIDGTTVTPTGRDLKIGLRPYAVDIAPSGNVAVVGNVGPDNGDVDTIGVIDLKANPARVVDIIPVGQGPEGIKISPDGRYVAVILQNGSNKPKDSPFYSPKGKLVLFSLNGTKLSRIADAPIGAWAQGVVFSKDGHTLLVCNPLDKNLGVFNWNGLTLRDTQERVALKGGPVAVRTAEK